MMIYYSSKQKAHPDTRIKMRHKYLKFSRRLWCLRNASRRGYILYNEICKDIL